jgi:hypothetical protein
MRVLLISGKTRPRPFNIRAWLELVLGKAEGHVGA